MSEDRLKILLEVVLGSGIGELQKLETSLKNLDTYSTSAQAGLKKITDVDFGRLSSQIDSVAGGMQKIGTAMSLIGVPMGLIAKESINMYADLESQIQRNTALLGGGKAEYEQILALSKELGASSPFDALEIGAGIEALAAAGYSLQDIQAAMPTVTEMAVATGEDLNSMSEILIATLNSYGESADMAGVYGDKLATIANISSASITDFGESMKYVGGIADAFGVDIDELGAVIGALADVNIKGSMAGTGLRSIITDLVSPTAKINDIFASFGLTMDDLNPKVVDFVEILQKMKDAGVSDEALMAAFGDRGGVVAVNMLSQLDKVKANYETLQNESVGMLKQFSAQMRDTLKFVMDEMGGTIANIMIEIGEGLKPIVQEMGQWLNDNQGTLVEFAKNAVEGLTPFVEKFMSLSAKLMEWFNSLPDDMQSKIGMLTGLGAAMATIGGPLLLLGSLPVRAISDVTGALAGLFTVAKTATGAGGLAGLAGEVAGLGGAAGGATPALAALFGPAGILAVGLGAGALAAYATNFGQFRDNINGVIGELGQAASNISTGDYVQAGRDMAEAVGAGFETVSDLITKGIPDASRIFYEFNVGLMDATTGMTRGLGQATGGFIRELSSDISTAISDLQSSLPELVIPTKIDSPNKAEYEANMKEFLDGTKSVIDNYDLSDSSTRFVTKAVVNSVTMGMGGNSIELVHQIGTFFKGIYEEGIIHAVDEFIAANPRMGLDKVEEHFKNSMNASDSNVASEYIGKMKTEMQKAFQGLEKEIETPLRNAGVSVKKFATQSAADIHNAMEKWQESFKESKLSYEDWMDSLKKSGQFDEYIADMQKYAETFPEITKEAGSAAQVIQGLDFMPVEFKAGNSIYANYKNNVLTPIVSEPIQIMLENATESEFNYILTHYNEIKNQIENSPINITYVGPAGDPEPNWGVTPHYTPDIQPNPNNATLNVTTATETGTKDGMVNAAPEVAQQTGKSVAEALAKEKGWYDKGQLDVQMAENFLAKNPAFAEQYSAKLKESSESTDKNTKGQEDLADSFKSLDEAIAHVMTTDKSSFVYDGKKYGREQNDDGSYSWQDQSNTAKEQRSILEKQQKEAEKTSKNTEDLGLQFQKGVSVQEAMLSAIQQYGGLNKAEGQKFTVGEDTYKIAVDSSGKIVAQAISATAKVAQGQQKAYDDLIKKQTDLNSKLTEAQNKLSTTEKTNKDGSKSSAYQNLENKIQDLKNEIQANQREINSQTSQIKDNTGTTAKLDSEQLKLIDSVDSTSKGISEFSEPVKTAGESTGKLADGSDKATGALQTFVDSLGNIDLEGLMQNLFTLPTEAFDRYVNQFMDNKEQKEDPDKAAEYRATAQKQYGDAISQVIARQGGSMIQQGYSAEELLDRNTTAGATLYTQIIAAMKQSSGGYTDPSWFRNPNDWATRQSIMESATPEEIAKAMDVYQSKHFTSLIQAMENGDVKMTGNDPSHQNVGWSSDVQLQFKDAETAQKYLGNSVDQTGTEAKTTTPQINTLNSAFEKIGLTGTGLSDVLSNVNNALSNHRASVLESEDYLSKYNQAAGENTKYTQDQERQTYSLMNSLGMLGTAQDMYNNYMSDGVLDATEAASVQQALAAATKMMGDAGITAEGGISGLPGALQALAGAAQAAMAAIQAAIGENTKYTQDQERQTYSLMNSLSMLGTAQNMYNSYMSDGVLDATEASHVQQALASATKMMGDAGITAEGGISGLPGALQALASAAQAAMSQIQAAISQAQSAASAAASGWKMQTSPTKYPTMAPSSPTNFNINMSNNTFPTGTKPSDVMRDINGMLRITA